MPSAADCRECGEHVSMPYECNYCGGHFCSSHQLPENHDCDYSEAETESTEKMFGDSIPGLDDDASAAGRSSSRDGRIVPLQVLVFVLAVIGAIVAAIALGIF